MGQPPHGPHVFLDLRTDGLALPVVLPLGGNAVPLRSHTDRKATGSIGPKLVCLGPTFRFFWHIMLRPSTAGQLWPGMGQWHV